MATDMKGKRCLVTGATSGIGRLTAEALAAAGAEVILVGRDPEKTEKVRAEIAAATGSAEVGVLIADMASLESIRAFGAAFHERYDRLDVLVNNAGGYNASRQETADGFELTFGVNHLGYFLTTLLLLPALRAASDARVVSVSSGAHRLARPNLDDLQSERGYSALRAYSDSKLFNLHFTFELAERLRDTAITANAMHPGAVASGFGSGPGWFGKVIALARPFMRTPAKGAETVIFLAASDEVRGVTGRYYIDRKPRTPSRAALDAELAGRLWTISEDLVGARFAAA